jgi:hypothetical protein
MPGRAAVVGVEREHLPKAAGGGPTVAQPSLSQCLEIATVSPVPAIEVVSEDQERRQGGCEVLEPLRLPGPSSSGTQQVLEQSRGAISVAPGA